MCKNEKCYGGATRGVSEKPKGAAAVRTRVGVTQKDPTEITTGWPELIRPREVERLSNGVLTEKGLRERRSKGGTDAIPYIRVTRRRVAYLRADIESHLQARRRRSTSDTGGLDG